jgi:hypothetical protein
MTQSISGGEVLRANGLDPKAGLRAPMAAHGTTSFRDLIGALTPRWNTIVGCFNDEDVHHMLYGSEEGEVRKPLNLLDYVDVSARGRDILVVVTSTDDSVRMPPPPRAPMQPTLIALFWRWVAGGTPL